MSINVPDEKAKAVIDALEREMMEKLATKAGLAHFQALLTRDILAARTDVHHDLTSLGSRLSHDLEALEPRLVIKMGTMMAASLVLTCAVLGTLLAALR